MGVSGDTSQNIVAAARIPHAEEGEPGVAELAHNDMGAAWEGQAAPMRMVAPAGEGTGQPCWSEADTPSLPMHSTEDVAAESQVRHRAPP
jgi:hypothetical protein